MGPRDDEVPGWVEWLARNPIAAIIVFALLTAGIPTAMVLFLDSRNPVERPAGPAGEPSVAVPGTLPRRIARGQTLYVPVHSHVYSGEGRKLRLAGTLGIRNTDDEHELTISAIRYYDTRGRLVRDHLDQPLVLGPLGTHDLFVPRSDESGGSGANFIVEWVAEEPTTAPLVEAVMVGTEGSGIAAFVRTAVVIDEVGTPLDD